MVSGSGAPLAYVASSPRSQVSSKRLHGIRDLASVSIYCDQSRLAGTIHPTPSLYNAVGIDSGFKLVHKIVQLKYLTVLTVWVLTLSGW